MKRIIILALMATLAASLGFAQADLQPAAIVKLSKTEPITVKQLKAEVQKMETQAGRPLTLDERKQVLDVLINEKLAIQGAEKEKITVSDGELNQQLTQARKGMAQSLGREPTDAEFELAVKNETGIPLAEYKDQMRRMLIVQKYLKAKKGSSFESLKEPTEAEIKQAYDLYSSKLVRPINVRVSALMVPFPASGDRTAAKALADSLVKQIGANASRFDEQFIKGQARDSNFQSADVGYLPKTPEAMKMVGADFFNVAFALKVNEVSRVIESPKGCYILKVTEILPQKSLELNDIYQLGYRYTVKEFLGKQLMQQKQQNALETAQKELVAELRTGNTYQIFEKNISW